MPRKEYSYTGIIHVHSTYSDGTRPVEEIVQIANELDIDFLLLTDHNTLKAKKEGKEGWYNDILLGIGYEINDIQDKNHYLAFDIDKEVDPELSPQEYTKKVQEMGGFGIIAHPNESRNHFPEYPPFPWTVWQTDSYDGIEIWNHMSEWMEGLTHHNKYRRALHPRRSVIAPKRETIRQWDAVNLHRKVVGIGGVDAHAHIHKLMGIIPVRIFRYKVSFRTIRTHILLDQPLRASNDYKDDLSLVYRAMRDARCFVSHNAFGDARTFRFRLENGNQIVSIGEELSGSSEARAIVRNPKDVETILFHNGEIQQRKFGRELDYKINIPGHYRVESWIDGRPWILSNHIRFNP
ncbi:MAG: hypothetical protein JXR46_15210 [Calditrichaceae bacterium]|nr:hypothetical protein [Calditrichaceae bacterium]MBN2710391.1 hypothetical protein [Calditrichaceae bacterium]RQV92887.1 MAG: histidinol-phosphatase [Calditrichota bacterium]